MIITPEQETFILHNRKVLLAIFKGRIEELKHEVIFLAKQEHRDAKIEMIREFDKWVTTIMAIEKAEEKEEKKEYREV